MEELIKQVPSYDAFVAHTDVALRAIARAHRLPIAEVKQIAYVAYRDAKATYRHDHPSEAQFFTYAKAILQRMVRSNSEEHASLDEDRTLHAHAFEDTTFYEVGHASRIDTGREAVAPDPEEHILALLAQHCEQIAFPELLKAHPSYTNPLYRAVMDAVLEFGDRPDAVSLIATRVKLTRRRVYQLLMMIAQSLQEDDVLALDRQIVLDENNSAIGESLIYRPLSGLTYRLPHQLELPKLLQETRRILRFGQIFPVIVDQYLRVVVGEEVCAASGVLGITSVKTMMRSIREGTHDSVDVLAALRAEINPSAGENSYDVDVINSLRNRVANGSLSVLVASRLAHLPRRIQENLGGQLGGMFVCALTIRDANEIVAAYDPNQGDYMGEFSRFLACKVAEITKRIVQRRGNSGD